MRLVALALLITLIGCSKAEPEQNDGGAKADQSEHFAPDVGVSQTPGLALNYYYSFRLPIERLAKTQEQHAAACEAMGSARCRITGMTYEAGENRAIWASLKLKLAPELARGFGKKGIETVVENGGMLAETRIESEEVGAAIAATENDTASRAKERNDITAQLAKPGLGSVERTQLQNRLAQLNDAERQNAAAKSSGLLKLASTPMELNYVSGNVDPGFSDGPILGALKDGFRNIVDGAAFILKMLITLIPWAALASLVIWLWRRFGARLGLRSSDGE